MQCMLRIYVAHCGFRSAWYDSLLIPLTDPVTGEPTDTILHLINGGGKTTLLSLIFSIFEPEKNRFLKHLQDQVNRFTQYFSNDGRPGFIVVEWLMPPRTAKGSPYKLVVGQVVSLRTSVEPADADRLFFSFVERSDLTLEDIPGPGLKGPEALTFQEVERWVQRMKDASPDFYGIKDNQGAWKSHLRNERQLDLDMLQMQLGFSAQEGGFDAFIKFKNESEFLRKFMALTQDASKADAARDLVVRLIEKHSRKPEYTSRLKALTGLRVPLLAFAEAADRYLASVMDRAQVALRGARLSLALQERHGLLLNEERAEREEESLQADIAKQANDEGGRLAREHATVLSLWYDKTAATAMAQAAQAAEAVTQLERKDRFVRAARLHNGITSLEHHIEDLQAQIDLNTDGLKPDRGQAELQGALLNGGLLREEIRLSKQQQDIKDRESERAQRQQQLVRDQTKARNAQIDLEKEKTSLEVAEQRRQQQLAGLEAEGLLEGIDSDVRQAAAEWGFRVTQHEALREEHRSARVRARERAEECRSQAGREREEAESFKLEAQSQALFVSRGLSEQERLSQLPALKEAAQADLVDPHSFLLRQDLARLVASYSQHISRVDVQIAELQLTKTAIDTTGIAGHSAEVDHVVKILLDAGVRSAKPFCEYLAGAEKDADRARTLVSSDPARFQGVSVARQEFEKAVGVQWDGRRPRKPVMVSITSLTAAVSAEDRCVVPAENDAAFNIAAAAQLAPKIAATLEADQTERKGLAARHDDCIKAEQDLGVFLEVFGEGKLADAESKATIAQENAEVALERAQAHDREASEQDNKAETLLEQHNAAARAAEEAKVAERRLQEFIRHFEDGWEHRARRLRELPLLIAEKEEIQSAASLELEELASQRSLDAASAAEFRVKEMQLAEERSKIKFCDKAYDPSEHLRTRPISLQELREAYSSAESVYLAKEEAQVIKLASARDSAQMRKAEKDREFAREFGSKGVAISDMQPYFFVDHDEVLHQAEIALQAARGDAAQAQARQLSATSESSKWRKQNRDLIDPPTAAMHAMAESQLKAEADRLQHAQSVRVEHAQRAGQASSLAKERANRKKTAADHHFQADRNLRVMMSLGERASLDRIKADAYELTGRVLEEADVFAVVLQEDPQDQANFLSNSFQSLGKDVDKKMRVARGEFEKLQRAASAPEFEAADKGLSHAMRENTFEATCQAAQRHVSQLDDRIDTTTKTLKTMESDYDTAVEEVLGVVRGAILTLQKAASPDKFVPAGAPYVGGKQILRMRANFTAINHETRKQALRIYLDLLTETKAVPVTGTDLISECVTRIHQGPLGLQVLKMSIEETEQYVLVDRISNSGGEGVVMAMFMYLLISELRSENFAAIQKTAGGPLLLDNPFAKVTSAAMWKAQRLLARAMKVQLIFATAVEDYNALAEFDRFVRFRKTHQNKSTRRWHIELADYSFTGNPDQATVS